MATGSPAGAQPDAAAAQARLEMLQRRIQALDSRSQSLQEAMLDLQQARAALQGIGDATSDGAMIPLGGGVHARGTIARDQPVVVPIGAGYAVEEDRDAAIERMASRISDVTGVVESTHQEIERLVQEARGLQAAVGAGAAAPPRSA